MTSNTFSDALGGERRGRFVENEEARLAVDRLGDLDELPVGERKIGDQRRQTDMVAADAVQRVARPASRPTADEAQGRAAIDDEEVVADREMRHQRQFLKHADDAERRGVARRGEAPRDAVHGDGAGVGRDHAGEQLHQRGLAGAVLAEDGVNDSGVDGQRNLGQSRNRAIAFRYVRQLDERGHRAVLAAQPLFAAFWPISSCGVKTGKHCG